MRSGTLFRTGEGRDEGKSQCDHRIGSSQFIRPHDGAAVWHEQLSFLLKFSRKLSLAVSEVFIYLTCLCLP